MKYSYKNKRAKIAKEQRKKYAFQKKFWKRIQRKFKKKGIFFIINDNNKNNALMWSVKNGLFGCVKLFLKHSKNIKHVNVNCIDGYGYTPLIWACKKGYTNIVKLLLQHPDIDVNLYHKCKGMQNRSPLAWACQEGHADIVVLLLQQPDINVNCIGNYGWTALDWAIRKDHTDIVNIIKKYQYEEDVKRVQILLHSYPNTLYKDLSGVILSFLQGEEK